MSKIKNFFRQAFRVNFIPNPPGDYNEEISNTMKNVWETS